MADFQQTGTTGNGAAQPRRSEKGQGPIVQLDDVHLKLPSLAGEVHILRGLELDVARGQTAAIVGPSGSGKSTMMMVMAGLERPSSGRVVVDGTDLSKLSEDALALFRRDRIGIVFQNFHLVPTMTALENVAMPLEFAGRRDAFDRAEAGLAAVGLDHRLTHYPAQLSGGEQQRVALARACAPEPLLLLADEPTGNLDGDTGTAVMDLLFALHDSMDTTLLLITHDANLAKRCDRTIRMADGRISESGGQPRSDAEGLQGERMSDWPLAVRLARREMRGGLKGFRIFLACLALGVGAIAAIGSLSSGVKDSLQRDARALLGGDIEARVIHRPASAAPLEWLRREATVATVIELRAMAYRGAGDAPAGVRDRLLVELKAVDGAYPLYGQVETDKGIIGAAEVARRLAPSDGLPNALVDPLVLARMRLKVGDTLKIGDATVRIGGTIEREPDRSTGLFTLGPRVLVSEAALKAAGLLRPGSLVYYRYRAKLPPGADATAFARRLTEAFPDEGWRVRNLTQAAPGVRGFIDRMTLYLTLVGLTALLVGGMGIANGVRAYLDGRTATIATFKCVGAPAGLVFRIYLIQVMALATIGVGAGLVLGAVLPVGLTSVLEGVLPVKVSLGLYPAPLALAAAFGFLTALAFSLWAVARAREVSPATLFRQTVAPASGRPRPIYVAITATLFLILGGLAIGTAVDKMMAAIFVGAAAATFIIFRGVAWLVEWTAARLSAPGGTPLGRPSLRLALANLHRPGAPTTSVVLSLGLGVTVLVAIALIQGNLTNQVARQLPARAPSYFFIDIQPNQVKAFDAAVRSVDGAHGLQRMPMVRARIARLNGVSVREAKVAKEVRWATRNERGLTYAAEPPANARIVAGKWWPADYSGPPLISFDQRLAEGMGLTVGDTITFNILGRDIRATIANLREIRWQTLAVNFTVIFAPGTLENAPHSHIAAVHVPPDKELALVRAVTDKLPNVSAIRVRDALDTAASVLGNIAFAVRVTAGVTLLAGLLVLAGAVAAGHGRRVYDAIVLKVVGATRGRILRTFLLEHGLLGLATSIIAALLGTLTAYLVLTLAMNAEWEFLPGIAIGTALICTVVTIVFGFVGTWRAMGQKPAPLLRNE